MNIDVSPLVLVQDYEKVVAATRGYSDLTIGSAEEHVQDLRRVTSFGGGCLLAAQIAQPPEAYVPVNWNDDPDHPTLPIELEEVA